MSDNRTHTVFSNSSGVFKGLTKRVKLILLLMADSRVNPLLKLIPLASLIYLDIPDLLIGPIDDAAVIWIGAYLFVELCPPEVVQEHMQALNRESSDGWTSPQPEDEVIDGEVIDVEPPKKQ